MKMKRTTLLSTALIMGLGLLMAGTTARGGWGPKGVENWAYGVEVKNDSSIPVHIFVLGTNFDERSGELASSRTGRVDLPTAKKLKKVSLTIGSQEFVLDNIDTPGSTRDSKTLKIENWPGLLFQGSLIITINPLPENQNQRVVINISQKIDTGKTKDFGVPEGERPRSGDEYELQSTPGGDEWRPYSAERGIPMVPDLQRMTPVDKSKYK